jgi:glycosyltransferase involved in cell wall biosynthesis
VRIAIDARELIGKPTGVGRYLAQVIEAWRAMPGAAAHEFIFCSPAPLSLDASPLRITTIVEPGGAVRVRGGDRHVAAGTVWEQLTLPRLVRAAGANVLFAPGYTGPLWGRTPMVAVVHDVSFAAHPEWFSWREGMRRRVLTRLSARRAVHVLTVSDFSKREIVRHLGIAHEKVDVVYHGVHAFTSQIPDPRSQTDPKSQIANPESESHSTIKDHTSTIPTVLYVGSIFERRHIPELIAGFARMAATHPDVRLEIVGDNRVQPPIDIARLATAAGVGGRVRARAYVADPELADLYSSATAFAFLSDYEGFGLTPLEALGVGLPIVVLDTEISREIYGPAAVYVRMADAGSIATALEQVLFDPATQARLLEAAPPVLARYSWEACAHRTLQILLASAKV